MGGNEKYCSSVLFMHSRVRTVYILNKWRGREGRIHGGRGGGRETWWEGGRHGGREGDMVGGREGDMVGEGEEGERILIGDYSSPIPC